MHGNPMELDAGVCRLRPFGPADRAGLVLIANDPQVWCNLTDRFPHPYTDADAAAWVAVCQAQEGPTRNLAVEVDQHLAGGAGLELRGGERTGTAEVGYWLGTRYWGRGLATAALRALSAYAFETFDLVRLEASVFGWNPASARVLEKVGFQLEGRLLQAVVKDGDRTDLLQYGLLRADHGLRTASG